MSVPAFDPYRALHHSEWKQRFDHSVRNPSEAVFLALAMVGFAALLIPAAATLWPRLLQLTVWLRDDYPIQSLVLIAVVVGINARRVTDRRHRAWATDWLAAQPVARAVRRRRTWLGNAARCAGFAVPEALLLAVVGSTASDILVLIGTTVVAFATGAMVWPRHAGTALRTRLETPFRVGRAPTFAAWQWTEAGASLAPASVSPLFLLLLLVPHGPWTMLFPALFGVAMMGLLNAFSRSARVIPLAEAWLKPQGLPGPTWLRGALTTPLLLAIAFVVLMMLPLAALAGATFALAAAVAVLAVMLLYLAVVIHWRRQPQRIALHSTIHLVLLVAVAQSMPPLLPLLWGLQVVWLLRRGWR